MIEGLRTYSVQRAAREPLLRFIDGGLRDAGCKILFISPPTIAPFVVTFESPIGERLGTVVYAFRATRTPTLNRPDDERSFQIKYGTKERYGGENLHGLWQDPLHLFTTLLVGIDIEENFFVAADPEVHNPTKFFIRMEFKDEHAVAIQTGGWHAWSRAKRVSTHGEPSEVLVGGTRAELLRLVRFERNAVGLSPTERLRVANATRPSSP